MPRATNNPCCTSTELAQSSLVARLLEIQDYQVVNDKSVAWAECLSCLWIESDDTLRLGGGPYRTIKDYIAVSYSWKETPGLEDSKAGSYSIGDWKDRNLRPSRVRDEVLSRVIRYAKYHQILRFWIDRECIPEDEPGVRQIAMDSMDLVYRNSPNPVGLLAVILETQDEVNTLQRLLQGLYAYQDDESTPPKLAHPVYALSSLAAFSLLRLLQSDRWWTRAWIFQEEYLSSTKMHLLIRRKYGTVALHEFGYLDGELCINAADFREQATIFLLAFKRKAGDQLSRTCTEMLKTFGKYRVLYRFQNDARRKAMAPRIFADIERRQIKKPYDRISIAANSCDYAVRFDSQIMSKSTHSIGLCLLTMYLLNGEILRGFRDITKCPTETDLSNYLQHISFNKFDPPVQGNDLSYLKACRLHGVSLSHEGVRAKGHLWRIFGTLPTCAWPHPRRWSRKDHRTGLNDFQRDCLHQAVVELKGCNQGLHSLAGRLYQYLKRDRLDTRPSPAKQHMDLMAEFVVEAIRTRSPLQVVGLHGSDLASGLFVGSVAPATEIFTSWHSDFGEDGRYRQSHVSLGVEVEWTTRDPFLATVKWVNGLAFFGQCEQMYVTFRWPREWTRSF